MRTVTARRPTVSVRIRITAAITVVAALGLLAVGFATYITERQRTVHQVDRVLNSQLDATRFLVEQGNADTGEWDDLEQALRTVVQRASPDDNTGVVGIVDGHAAMVPGIGVDVDLQSAPGFVPYVVSHTASEPVIGTYAEEGVAWRFLAIPIQVHAADTTEAIFVIAYDLVAELGELNVAARIWMIASAVTIAVIAAVAVLVTTRLLRPLRRMRETAERISAGHLSERLPIDGHDDVSDLAATMNDMWDRLDRAMTAQRHLLGDVGHELKTPITVVRGHLELVDPDNPAEVRETVTLTLDELDRVSQLLQDLADAASVHDPRAVQLSPTDVADLIDQIALKAQGIPGASVTVGPVAQVVAEVDSRRITQALLQLAQNAVTHGGGTLEISARTDGDLLRLQVSDHGPGVPDADKERVFGRFQRGNPARRGSGLGLNIVRLIARAHQGIADITDTPGGGATFILTIPLAHHPTQERTPDASNSGR